MATVREKLSQDYQNGTTVIATTHIEKAEILAEYFSSVLTNENDNDMTMLGNVHFEEKSRNDNFTVKEVN